MKRICLISLMVILSIKTECFCQRKLPNEVRASKTTESSEEQIKLFLVCDNDFAVFVGNEDEILREIYQNNEEWPQQISQVNIVSFNPIASEDTIYLLAIGGGLS